MSKGHPMISVRFAPDELARLRAAAAACEDTVADFVRRCVLEELNREDNSKKKEKSAR